MDDQLEWLGPAIRFPNRVLVGFERSLGDGLRALSQKAIREESSSIANPPRQSGAGRLAGSSAQVTVFGLCGSRVTPVVAVTGWPGATRPARFW